MKTLLRCILVGAVLTLIPLSSQAAVGTAFTYQGELKKSGGLQNSTCDFQFSLYDALTGGTQIGSTQSVPGVTVTNGLFTVVLDFGAGAFSGSPRWMEISVQCAGDGGYTTLAPRLPLLPTPYSVYSSNAAVAGDLQCTACVSLSEVDFSPDTRYLQLTGGTLTGSLALPASGLAVGSNQITTTGGNVGIGRAPTSLWGTTLSVDGAVRAGMGNGNNCDLTLGDDICFYDEQNGTLSVRNFAGTAYAGVKALSFNTASSASFKKDIDRVSPDDLAGLRATVDHLPLYRFHYLNEPEAQTPHLGVIAERSPKQILSPDGKSVNLYDYVGLALGATKELSSEEVALQAKVRELETRNKKLSDQNTALARRIDRLERLEEGRGGR